MSGTDPLDSLDGKPRLAQVILTGCQGIPKSLPDDVLKVRVHVGMRARAGAEGKPRRGDGARSKPIEGRQLYRQKRSCRSLYVSQQPSGWPPRSCRPRSRSRS